MAKKKINLNMIWLFVTREQREMKIDDGKMWYYTDRAHQVEIPYTKLVYNYDPRLARLTVYRGATKIADITDLHYGDAALIKNPLGKAPSVSFLRYPHKRSDLILWLCGYKADERFDSKSEFSRFKREQRLGFPWNTHVKSIKGPNYQLFYQQKGDKVDLIAAYVDNNIDKNGAKEALARFEREVTDQSNFPEDFVTNVLHSQMGLSGNDCRHYLQPLTTVFA